MLNKKRKGFTLMEIVLVMVLIAILATGVAIGFTSYINRGHESGITTDFNSTFKNPVRMEAIEKGRMAKVEDVAAKAFADGFVYADNATNANWSDDVTVVDGEPAADATEAYVEKGNKRYQLLLSTYGDTSGWGEALAAPAIMVVADHSSSDSAVVYVLNEAKNDVITILGSYNDDATAGTFVFTPES